MPRKLLENAQTPTSRVHAVLGGGRCLPDSSMPMALTVFNGNAVFRFNTIGNFHSHAIAGRKITNAISRLVLFATLA